MWHHRAEEETGQDVGCRTAESGRRVDHPRLTREEIEEEESLRPDSEAQAAGGGRLEACDLAALLQLLKRTLHTQERETLKQEDIGRGCSSNQAGSEKMFVVPHLDLILSFSKLLDLQNNSGSEQPLINMLQSTVVKLGRTQQSFPKTLLSHLEFTAAWPSLNRSRKNSRWYLTGCGSSFLSATISVGIKTQTYTLGGSLPLQITDLQSLSPTSGQPGPRNRPARSGRRASHMTLSSYRTLQSWTF